MRVAPAVSFQCYVCGSSFIVKNRVEQRGRQRVSLQDPSACPFCDAPVRAIPPIDLGQAKGLLLTQVESPKDASGAAQRFLEGATRTEADVDALWALASDLDFDAWEAGLRGLMGDGGDREVEKELRQVGRLREAARDGALLKRLQTSVARVKAEHAALKQRHLAIFEQRR